MSELQQSILEAVGRYEWYQSIPLTDGVVTPGETGDAAQNKLEMMNLPDDLSGRAVIDIGCNEGFFAFEAERRNAKHTVAVDKGELARKKFELVKTILESKAEFLSANLLDLRAADIGRFDVVFFLSVFHHLRYPFLVIDRIYELTKGFVIFEFVEAVPDVHDEQAALVRKLSKKGHLHMLPTRAFTMEMLERAGFSNIEVLGTHRSHKLKSNRGMPGFSERRVLLRAHR